MLVIIKETGKVSDIAVAKADELIKSGKASKPGEKPKAKPKPKAEDKQEVRDEPKAETENDNNDKK